MSFHFWIDTHSRQGSKGVCVLIAFNSKLGRIGDSVTASSFKHDLTKLIPVVFLGAGWVMHVQ